MAHERLLAAKMRLEQRMAMGEPQNHMRGELINGLMFAKSYESDHFIMWDPRLPDYKLYHPRMGVMNRSPLIRVDFYFIRRRADALATIEFMFAQAREELGLTVNA